jgi:enoyl-CoA hydratase
MSYSYLVIKCEKQVATLTISRLERLNVLNHALLHEMDQAFAELLADDRVRVVIVTGAGTKTFVAGADIHDLANLTSVNEALAQSQLGQAIFTRIDEFPKPVLMAINGYCLGGGCELALAGDIRIASDNARLGLPEINLAILPGWGGTQRLAHLVGRSRAKLMLFTGESLTAQEALQIGLVDQVLPQEGFQAEVHALAEKIAAKAPIALRLAKTAVNASTGTDLETGCMVERTCFVTACNTQDRVEATRAFLEKRPFTPAGK